MVTLSVLGKDPSTLVAFASGPIVGVVVGALAKGKLGAVAADVAVVKQQTNGQLQGPLTQILAAQVQAADQHAADTQANAEVQAQIAATVAQTADVVQAAVTDGSSAGVGQPAGVAGVPAQAAGR